MKPRSERKTWLRQHRLARQWAVSHVAAAMTAIDYRTPRGGVLSGGSVRSWEAPGGAEPGRKAVMYLERVFGDNAPPDGITVARRKELELSALRDLERAVLIHDHGTGVTGPGISHHPCSLCDALDEVRRARRS